MKRISFLLLYVAGILACHSLIAQEPAQFPGPEKEHQWLHQFVGSWVTESKGTMGPDQPPIETTGTLTSKMLGEFWVVNQMVGDFMGTQMNGIQTIGYDATKKKYIGTWVDSMAGHMWVYEGTVDETGKILTLEADGPNFMDAGKTTKFQDIYEFKSADEMVMTSKMLGTDGKWVTFMTGTAKRKK
jgi:hypothetical protein